MKSFVSLAVIPLLALALVAARATDASAACNKLECGSNSPIVDTYEFHELNEVGLYNNAGLRVRYLVKNGTSYTPDVIGGRLVGRGFMNAIMVEHEQLKGSYVELLTTSNVLYKMYIDHVTVGVPFSVGPGAAESYELTYNGGLITQKRPVCPNPQRTAGVPSQALKEGFLYAGERFNAATKRVLPALSTDDQWFNVACYGSALYKLYLTRHTDAAAEPGFTTTAAQHQAMLKMYVGDVCGNGNSFTTQGTPLYWQNPIFGWGSAVIGQDFLEGLWHEHGALCIQNFRKGAAYYQSVVVPACGTLLPPTCASAYPSLSPFPANAYLFTTIPQVIQ